MKYNLTRRFYSWLNLVDKFNRFYMFSTVVDDKYDSVDGWRIDMLGTEIKSRDVVEANIKGSARISVHRIALVDVGRSPPSDCCWVKVFSILNRWYPSRYLIPSSLVMSGFIVDELHFKQVFLVVQTRFLSSNSSSIGQVNLKTAYLILPPFKFTHLKFKAVRYYKLFPRLITSSVLLLLLPIILGLFRFISFVAGFFT